MTSFASRLSIAFRIALRELRGGLKGFYIFLACIALGTGAIAAVAVYRMAKTKGSQAGPAPVPGNVSTPAPATPPAPAPTATDALAAAALGDGRGSNASLPGDNAPSAEAARILAGLRSANSGNRATLGFDP